jgi:outer membrane protein assembly factor BamB
MGKRLREHLGRTTVALPLAVAVLLVSFGTGYRSSKVVQHDGSAWLAKGRTAAHVNGETGRSDAEVARDLATGRQRLEVVQTPSGEVYAVNHDTGTVTRIDTATMRPAATRKHPASSGEVEVVAGGRSTYVVDRRQGKVHQVDPKTLAPMRTVDLPGGIAGAVVDGTGTCWALEGRRGRVRRIVDGHAASEVDVGADQGARLTLVGDRPVVVKPASGEIVALDGDRAATPVRLPAPPGERIQVSLPASSGSTAWVALGERGELVGVDLDSGRSRSVGLVGRQDQGGVRPAFGPPVAAGGRVYVPDYTNRVVRVVEAGNMRRLPNVPVPGRGEFELFHRNGKVWINDPYRQEGTVIGSDGRPSPFDKGPGHGVEGDRPPAPAVTQPPDPKTAGDAAPRIPPGPEPTAPERAPAPSGQPGSGPAEPTGGPPATAPGEQLLEVPDVVGMDEQEACARLQQARLTCRPEVSPPQAGATPGKVLATEPPAGARVRPGRLVTVRHLGKASVPDVVGRPAVEACQLVAGAGLTCSQSDRGAAPPGQQTGVAVAQQPAAGTTVVGGTAVVVELYGATQVPNVTGQPVDQACATLQQSNLGCQQVQTRAAQAANVVHTQQPAAGTAAGPGSAVQVHFDPTGVSPLHRLKRLNTNVWVITSNEQHYQNLMAGGTGHVYLDEGVIGQAYAPGAPGAPDLAPVYSIHCNLQDGHIGNIIYHAKIPEPPTNLPPSTNPRCSVQPGYAALVLNHYAPGTVRLHRMIKHHDNTVSYAYATERDMPRFLNAGWGISGEPLGWVW